MKNLNKNKILKTYAELVSLKIQTKVKFQCWTNDNETAELVIYDNSNLKQILKIVNVLGIHKLEKKEFHSGSQYAEGTTTDKTIHVLVHPSYETKVFQGCRIVTWEEKIEVPATEAHTEIITKSKTICGVEA